MLPSHQNDLYKNGSSLSGLSNAIYRLMLRCLIFEISMGGDTPSSRQKLNLSEPTRKGFLVPAERGGNLVNAFVSLASEKWTE